MRAWRGLYAIVDPAACRGRDALAVAGAILEGGCAVLQLRDKRGDARVRESLALQLRALCRQAGTAFVINDYVELALRVGADGLHLGQGDTPLPQARAQLGAEVAIGLSTHDLAQARAAGEAGADLIGFGPVFATRSKRDPDPVVGLAGLRAACAEIALPVVAIGGIGPDNAAEIAASGAAMGAAISALCGADDPRAAARRLHDALLGQS